MNRNVTSFLTILFLIILSITSAAAVECSWSEPFTNEMTLRSLTMQTDVLEPGAIVDINGLLQANVRTAIDFMAISIELEQDESRNVNEIDYEDELLLFESASFEEGNMLNRQTTYSLDGSGTYTFTPTLVVNQTTYTLSSCSFEITPDEYSVQLEASSLLVSLGDEVTLTANAAFGTVSVDSMAILADNRVIASCEDQNTCTGTFTQSRVDDVRFRARARYGNEAVYSQSIFVDFVGEIDPPTIDVSYVPPFPDIGDLVTITVQSSDESAIKRVELTAAGESAGVCNSRYCTFSHRTTSKSTTLLIEVEDDWGNAQTYVRHLVSRGTDVPEPEVEEEIVTEETSPVFIETDAEDAVVEEQAPTLVADQETVDVDVAAEPVIETTQEEQQSTVEPWKVTKHVATVTAVLDITSRARLFALVLILLAVGMIIGAVFVARSK